MSVRPAGDTAVSRTLLQAYFDILNPRPREFSTYTLITCICACSRRRSDILHSIAGGAQGRKFFFPKKKRNN